MVVIICLVCRVGLMVLWLRRRRWVLVGMVGGVCLV